MRRSRCRLCRLHSRADRGELIGGQRLLREQQAGAFVKIGMARAKDVGGPAEGLCHEVAHRDVDLALGRLRGVDAVTGGPGQERKRKGVGFGCDLTPGARQPT